MKSIGSILSQLAQQAAAQRAQQTEAQPAEQQPARKLYQSAIPGNGNTVIVLLLDEYGDRVSSQIVSREDYDAGNY